MKIKKVRIKQLLKLHLLKSKVYERPFKKRKFDNLIDANLNQIITDIKKALQIIFYFDKTEKRILFIGLPHSFENKINQLTKHVAISKNFDVQGIFSGSSLKSFNNNKTSNQTWSKNSLQFLLPKLTKRLDLIVLFEHDKKRIVLSEAQAIRIPVINFGTDLDSDINALYNVEGNFKNSLSGIDKNLFFVGLRFFFNKSRKK